MIDLEQEIELRHKCMSNFNSEIIIENENTRQTRGQVD